MRTKRNLIALVAGSTLILGGLMYTSPALAEGTSWSTLDAMHNSPAMERMHDQMPADLQGQCDRMHDRMSDWLSDNADRPMMGGSGGMMGQGMMSY